jgi:hypothetical protein
MCKCYFIHAHNKNTSIPLHRFSLHSQALNSVTSKIPILNFTGIARATRKVRSEIRFCPPRNEWLQLSKFQTFTLPQKVFLKKMPCTEFHENLRYGSIVDAYVTVGQPEVRGTYSERSAM